MVRLVAAILVGSVAVANAERPPPTVTATKLMLHRDIAPPVRIAIGRTTASQPRVIQPCALSIVLTSGGPPIKHVAVVVTYGGNRPARQAVSVGLDDGTQVRLKPVQVKLPAKPLAMEGRFIVNIDRTFKTDGETWRVRGSIAVAGTVCAFDGV